MKPEFMGKMVDVVITAANKYSLMGEPLADLEPIQPDVPEALQKGQISGLSAADPATESPCVSSADKWNWPLLTVTSIVLLRFGWIIWKHRR